MPTTFRAYLELARLSNGPTLISNVLVGAALALHGRDIAPVDMPWITIAMTAVAMLSFYVGGMALNDVADLHHDRLERPERPIPAGRVSLRGAWTLIIVAFALGLALLAACGMAALTFGTLLLISIIGYDLLHKQFPPSVILMGLCRGLVYLTAAAAVAWPLDLENALPLAIAITIYVTLITIIARGEGGGPGGISIDLSRRLSMLIVLVGVAPAILIFPDRVEALVIAGMAAIAWLVLLQRHLLVNPPRMKAAVMGWLAGICLVDAFYLALLDQPLLVAIAGACFGATLLAHRRIAGT